MNKTRIILVSLIFLLASSLLAWGILRINHAERVWAKQPKTLGVSFSDKYARELGLDPVKTYLALLNDLKIKHFRLMSYWDEIQPAKDQFDFTFLDYQMQQAEAKGADVSLAVGLRQPRYPECFQPDWTKKLSEADFKAALNNYLAKVVNRYKTSPVLASYQLENEAENKVFGQCSNFDHSRLQEEFNLVKHLDSVHPVIANLSNEWGIPLRKPLGDVVGLSIYRTAYLHQAGFGYFHYPFPAWLHGLRARVVELIWGTPAIIHELQAEPWGPKATVDLSVSAQNKSMNVAKLRASVNYSKSTGIDPIYLWGGEWWYWRLTHFHDSSVWDAARQIFATSQ